MTAGTVTGEKSKVFVCTHAAGAAPSFTGKTHSLWGMGDFSLTMNRGIVEQDLIGTAGNYKDQGSLSVDGSLTISKLDTQGNAEFLNNVLDGTGTNKYFAVSANIGGAEGADATSYIRAYLVSCQVTGWDTSVGDADTITEASIDFVEINPQSVRYKAGLISDGVV